MAMWFGMAAVVMLFAAFTSAMVVRQGLSTDWVSFPLPRILGLSTAILLASSLTLELSRRSLQAGSGESFARWLYVTTLLGLMFLGSQLAAWRELASRGVYLVTNPSSSFFYLLTAAHGVHLLGGVVALLYLVVRAGRIALNPRRATAVDVTAIYWHFMDGLWLYILLLLIVRS
jgi:cytochrome c oxidase subunit 3